MDLYELRDSYRMMVESREGYDAARDRFLVGLLGFFDLAPEARPCSRDMLAELLGVQAETLSTWVHRRRKKDRERVDAAA